MKNIKYDNWGEFQLVFAGFVNSSCKLVLSLPRVNLVILCDKNDCFDKNETLLVKKTKPELFLPLVNAKITLK